MPHPTGRRRLLQALAAAGTLGPAGLSGLIAEALADERKPVATGMRSITGTVTVNGQPAREGMHVGPGDRVETGPDSQAIYVIGRDAYLQREKSSVGFAANALRMITGGLLSVFGKGNKKLEVATATIGIRGTGCYLETQGSSVYFCLCYGTANVAPSADPKRIERIATKHHDHPVLIHGDRGAPIMAATSVVNHTDKELILLESLVGRRPPFYGKLSGDDSY